LVASSEAAGVGGMGDSSEGLVRGRVRRKEVRIEELVEGRVDVLVLVVGDCGCGSLVLVEERVDEDERRRGGVGLGLVGLEDRGTISFAIRASMKVMNVKATLWTGAEESISRIQDCESVSDDLVLLVVFICESS